jgi:hypothetical protein
MKLKSYVEKETKCIRNKCSMIVNGDIKVAKGMNDLAIAQAIGF